MAIYYALIGGLIIGLSTTIMLLYLGRITGISGITAKLLQPSFKDNNWSYFFIAGLLSTGVIFKIFRPNYFDYTFDTSWPVIIIAGLLVGFGTRLGSGCTSGHGVCGLPRLSKRSIIATLIFMTFGVLTQTLQGLLS